MLHRRMSLMESVIMAFRAFKFRPIPLIVGLASGVALSVPAIADGTFHRPVRHVAPPPQVRFVPRVITRTVYVRQPGPVSVPFR